MLDKKEKKTKSKIMVYDCPQCNAVNRVDECVDKSGVCIRYVCPHCDHRATPHNTQRYYQKV